MGARLSARSWLRVWGVFSSRPAAQADVFHLGCLPLASAAGSWHGLTGEGSPCLLHTRQRARLGMTSYSCPCPTEGIRAGHGERGGGDAGRAEGVSGWRCHCRGIWPGWRRGEREGEEKPGTLGTWDSACAPPHPAQLCPQVPSASLSPNPLLQFSRELVPPFPSLVSREIQMFGPSSALLSLAPCQMFPLPPEQGCVLPSWGH